jgi:hypothetical protein
MGRNIRLFEGALAHLPVRTRLKPRRTARLSARPEQALDCPVLSETVWCSREDSKVIQNRQQLSFNAREESWNDKTASFERRQSNSGHSRPSGARFHQLNFRKLSVQKQILRQCLVRSRRLELPRALAHNDLNVARLPVPPRPHSGKTGEVGAVRTVPLPVVGARR